MLVVLVPKTPDPNCRTSPPLTLVPMLENVVDVTLVNAPVLAVLAPIAPVRYPVICPALVVVTDVATTEFGVVAPTVPLCAPVVAP